MAFAGMGSTPDHRHRIDATLILKEAIMALSRQQLSELKNILETRCMVLDAEIRADASRVRDESVATLTRGQGDSGDGAMADQIADLGNAELLRDVNELRELQAAQARFDDGSFGRCLDCNEEIEYSRLRAQPAASRCLDCQRRYEATHVHAATPKL